jgi:DivIVA domain-containing protein
MSEKLNSIDRIRTEVENEHRFPTVRRRGYDKKSVNQYLEELEEQHSQELEKEQEKTNAALLKNEELLEQMEVMNVKLDELRAKIKNREATEESVAQSVVEGLKETNQRLTEENQRKQLKITELEEKINQISGDVSDYSHMLVLLDNKLKEMLKNKFIECEDIIVAWEQQFEKNSENIQDKIKKMGL